MQITKTDWTYNERFGAGYLTLDEGLYESDKTLELEYPNAYIQFDLDDSGNIIGIEVISK